MVGGGEMINQIGGSSWCSGNCLAIVSGRVILENHLSALCLLISVGLVPEIITYFLGRGPAGGRQPSAQAYGIRLWTAYRVSSDKLRFTVNCDRLFLVFLFPRYFLYYIEPSNDLPFPEKNLEYCCRNRN